MFAKSSCNDLIVSDSSARTVISGHFDKTVKFWDNRAQGGANYNQPVNEINLGAKVTSLSLSKGSFFLPLIIPSIKTLLFGLPCPSETGEILGPLVFKRLRDLAFESTVY